MIKEDVCGNENSIIINSKALLIKWLPLQNYFLKSSSVQNIRI